jgi:hypothetical protein
VEETRELTRQGVTAEATPIAAADAETLTNENGIRQYMKAVVRFRETLLVVAHVDMMLPGVNRHEAQSC